MTYALGGLLGTMVDPLTWGVAIAVTVLGRHLAWWRRLGVAALTVMGLVILIVIAFSSNDPSNGRMLVFTLIATSAWVLIASGAQASWGKRAK